MVNLFKFRYIRIAEGNKPIRPPHVFFKQTMLSEAS